MANKKKDDKVVDEKIEDSVVSEAMDLDDGFEENEPSEVPSVSREEFDSLKGEMNKSFAQIVDLIKDKPKSAEVDAVSSAKEDKKIDEASSDMSEINPRYNAKAKEVLGERLARTYTVYPKEGGLLFTIVVAEKFSNAPKEYLAEMKEDRRTVNLEREEFRGEDGVEKWAKLVLQNLNRPVR